MTWILSACASLVDTGYFRPPVEATNIGVSVDHCHGRLFGIEPTSILGSARLDRRSAKKAAL